MFVSGGSVIYSASDLAAAARCEYALLRAFDAKLGRGPAVSVEDELLARTAKLGGEHEQRHLDELRELSEENVAIIGRPDYTVDGLTAAAEATMHAVQRRAPVIYQAAMFDGRFVGFADFLVLDSDQYLLRDTKLARSVKVEALLQLAAYADTLARAGVPVASEVELVLGDGATVELPRRRTAAGLPAVGAPACNGCSTTTSPAVRRSRGRTRTCGRASAVRSARSRSAPTTTCCSSPGCG